MVGILNYNMDGWVKILTCLPLKMDAWNTSFLLGWPIFRGELLVSGGVSEIEIPIFEIGNW